MLRFHNIFSPDQECWVFSDFHNCTVVGKKAKQNPRSIRLIPLANAAGAVAECLLVLTVGDDESPVDVADIKLHGLVSSSCVDARPTRLLIVKKKVTLAHVMTWHHDNIFAPFAEQTYQHLDDIGWTYKTGGCWMDNGEKKWQLQEEIAKKYEETWTSGSSRTTQVAPEKSSSGTAPLFSRFCIDWGSKSRGAPFERTQI